MFDIRLIRENPEAFDEGLEKRGLAPQAAELIALDEQRRAHVGKLQEAQARRNAASKEIGKAMGAGDTATAEKLKAEVAELKEFVQTGEAKERELNDALTKALEVIPNLPLDDVPVGADEEANVQHKVVGDKPAFSFEPKEHYEIGEALGGMDFERAAKLSGSRFVVLRKQIARLERAIGQFMLDLHTEQHGYMEVQPPLLVNDSTMYGTGQLPKFKDDLFDARNLVLSFPATELEDTSIHKIISDGYKFKSPI
ncbi:MAG: serine--tRNA ligase, partial [Salaquimonas sp.]|nr:serine--tRNA ligase [Salaquimonas sp.]